MKPRNVGVISAAICAAVIGIVATVDLPNWWRSNQMGDAAEYIATADAIAHGVDYRDRWIWCAVHPPGYPLILSALGVRVPHLDSPPWLALAWNVLMVSIVAGFVAGITRRLLGVTWPGFYAGAVTIPFAVTTLSDATATAIIVLVTWLLIRRRWWWSAVLLSLGALVRSAIWPSSIFVAVWLVVTHRLRLRSCVVWLGIALAVPIAWRVIGGNPTITIYTIGNNIVTRGNPTAAAARWNEAVAELTALAPEDRAGEEMARFSVDVREHWRSIPVAVASSIGRALFSAQEPWRGYLPQISRWWSRPLWIAHGCLLIVGLFLVRRIPFEDLLLLAAFALPTWGYIMLLGGITRYLLQAVVLHSVLIALAIKPRGTP